MNISMNKIRSSGTRLGSDRVEASVLIAARVPAPVAVEVIVGVHASGSRVIYLGINTSVLL